MNEIVVSLLYIMTALITLALASREADKMLEKLSK